MIEMLEADADNALPGDFGAGHHPEEFTLLSYGGSGPLLLAGCSRGIGFKDIITFQFVAGFSAFGSTRADDMRRHSVSTQIDISARAFDDALVATGAWIANVRTVLERAAVDALLVAGQACEKIKTVPFFMARYSGQFEDIEVMASLPAVNSADDMRTALAQRRLAAAPTFWSMPPAPRRSSPSADIRTSCGGISSTPISTARSA